MKIRRLRVVQLPGLLLALATSVASAAPGPPPDLDRLVGRAMRTFEVPGIALAVVKDGQVVVAKGYGVRRLGEGPAIDGRTLFGIASNTKIFTAAALGLLVEEGKLRWDGPVVQYLPWFQMWDPWVTRELTVRDLLVHRSGLGLGAGDLLWWPPSTYSRREIAGRLRHIRPATGFRSAYAYDNLLYLVAGEVIEGVSGQSWEDFVSTRILAKVGMTGSNVRHSAARGRGNIASTHAEVDGQVRPIAPFDSDTTNAAGGINSGAEDMARWLATLLAEGEIPGGGRLFSRDTYRELTTIVTPMPIAAPPPELAAMRPNFLGYALGLKVRDYRGRRVLYHTGELPGYRSLVMLVPELGLGVAVLTNQESEAAFNSIGFSVVDYYLGETAGSHAGELDWVSAWERAATREAASAGQRGHDAVAGRAAAGASLSLQQYAGTYRDAWYGDVTIALERGGLVIRFGATPSLVGDLEHWQHDTFVARWRDRALRADAYVTFALTPDGRVDQAKMQAVSADTDFSYDFGDLLLKPVR